MSIFPYRITTSRPGSMRTMRMDIEKIRESQESMSLDIVKISECMEKLCSDTSPVFAEQKKASGWKVHL